LELTDPNPGLRSQLRAGQLPTRAENPIGGDSHTINSSCMLQTFGEEVICNGNPLLEGPAVAETLL
jgi:hypothetical protein